MFNENDYIVVLDIFSPDAKEYLCITRGIVTIYELLDDYKNGTLVEDLNGKDNIKSEITGTIELLIKDLKKEKIYNTCKDINITDLALDLKTYKRLQEDNINIIDIINYFYRISNCLDKYDIRTKKIIINKTKLLLSFINNEKVLEFNEHYKNQVIRKEITELNKKREEIESQIMKLKMSITSNKM